MFILQSRCRKEATWPACAALRLHPAFIGRREKAPHERRRHRRPLPVSEGKDFHLADHDPGDTVGLDINKKQAQSLLQLSVQRLSELQEKLYAQDRWAVLLIFQAMDAAGKDSVIEHVMKGINPQGCEVHSF